MDYLPIFGIVVLLNSPIYLLLFKIQGRLTKVETILNGGKKSE